MFRTSEPEQWRSAMTTFVEFIDRLIDVKTQSRDQMAGELRQTGRIFPIDGF